MFQPLTPGPPPRTLLIWFWLLWCANTDRIFKGAGSHPTEEVLGLAGIQEVAPLMLQEILATQTHSSLWAESDFS